MSQAGKVLHVYMEVRSVPEDGGKMLEQEDNDSGNVGLPCLEFLPDFQKSFPHCSPNRSPDHSPITERHSRCSNRSVTPSKSPSSSRHVISFQLQNPDSTGSPTQYQRQDVVDDNFAEILRLVSPEGSSPELHGSLGLTHSSGKNCYKERGISPNFTPSGRLSVPNTPTCNPRSSQHQSVGGEEGRTSVVTFGYIEKSNVYSLGCRSSSVCQPELDSPLNRPKDLPKRLSDPMCYTSHPAQGDKNYPYRLQSPRGSTCMQKTTLNAVARDTTHTDFEMFGSPELKGRMDDRPERLSPTMHRAYQSSRCRSLESSPILPRNALTLPSKNKTWDLDRGVLHGSLNGLPRSPASEHLCGHTGFSPYLVAPGMTVYPHGPHRIQSLTEDQSPRLYRKYHSTLPAGRPRGVQNDFQTNKPSSSNQAWFSYQGSMDSHVSSSQHSINDICECPKRNHNKPSYRNGDSLSPSNGKRIVCPSSNVEMAYKVAVEATRLSPNFKNHLSTSLTPSQAESQRSLLSESQLTLQRCHSPEIPQMKNHGHQWNMQQSTMSGSRQGSLSPLRSHRGPSSPTSPALPARLHRAAVSQSPVLDPGVQIPSPSKYMPTLHRYQNPQYTQDYKQSGVDCRQFDSLCDRSFGTYSSQNDNATPRKQETSWRKSNDKSLLNPFQGNHRSCPTEEIQGQCRTAGNDSQSSSGVTGSITDSSQQLPETSSQSSYDAADTGSGIQADNSLATAAKTRFQKIAQAKFEFLFGSSKIEEEPCGKDSTTTPPNSHPPTSLSPSSRHLMPPDQSVGWNSKGQKLSQHKVWQIESELVTPNLKGFSPKTGIIRRTIKYSETDLDAVPLRCYRETDLDEVMRAEAEEVEADSAFSSNRSVLEISSFSPADISPKPWNGGGKGRHEEEEEEDDEQDEGAGRLGRWASVMSGDKQRQRAAKEEEEVFSLRLKGPLEASCEANSALKSPISVSSPRLSESNLDSFSRHFENIMESTRAKGTSYSSLDSVDLLTSGSTSVFTFDLPTLTPEIQSQICDSAKQITELSFAPLVQPDSATTAAVETSRSETTLNASGGGIQNGEKDDSSPRIRARSEKDSWRRTNAKDGVRKANSAPSLHSSPRERPVNPPLELLYPQADVAERLAEVAERLALGGSDDALPNGTSADLQAAKRLAKRLYHLDGFRKSDVARHLSKRNEFSQMVAEEYLSNFNFTGLTIDQSLRSFLNRFALIGETQERERVLAHFSRRYMECNPESVTLSVTPTEDSVHTLTCAIMLLNSDLHGNNIGKRMSCNQFITNLEGLNNGKDFPKDLLKTLYSSIKNEKLQWTIDEEEVRKTTMEQGDVRTDSASHTMKRLGSSGNPLMGLAQQADGEVYKSGFLVRKVHADPDGKRTPRGKRSWKSFYAMLKGLVLYLQKDEYRSERELTEDDLKNSVSIHHSLAMRAVDYSKRPNVFYLRTADWRVFLLQAPNAEQMQSWITRINVVAAIFSAPPFPAAIGSQKRFSRPLLPGSNTKLSQEEQVKSHENRFRAVSSELADLMASAADLKTLKGRDLEEHKQRLEYLEFEKTRYGTYAMLLRAKLSGGDQDLEAFESRLFDDGGLQRAHSSPLLPQDTSNKEKIRGTKMSKSLKVMSSSTSSTTKTTGSGGDDEKKNGNNTQSEPRKQSIKQEEVA